VSGPASEVACDVALVGGGLANGLIALWLRRRRPELRVLVLERGPRLGGEHTWSFHEEDVSEVRRRVLAPLVTKTWAGHEVHFPERRRRLSGAYHSIASARFHEVLARELGDGVRLGAPVAEVTPGAARLEDGTRVRASCVVDARGGLEGAAFVLAYQKFLGLELELAAPHGLAAPVLMDATVPQLDGFRFLYLLPWDERRVLVEDTRYSDTPALDAYGLRREVHGYAERRGWRVVRVAREEAGVLPIPLAGDVAAHWRALPPGVACAGVRAALFHPTTGYSLPQAAALAEAVAGLPELTSQAVRALAEARSRAAWRRGGFYRFLNRMLFLAAKPERRYRVLEHFYGLPEAVIARFYAGRTTLLDRVRILTGRAPVPLARAARCLVEPRHA
jgi:lycopene beta-cyclase